MNELIRVAGGPAAVQAVLAILMGVLPGMALSPTPPGPGVRPLTKTEERGRAVYIREGCSYCHTQQVRPLPSDRLFGRPSAPGDFAFQTPELLGSERTGPDLSNVGTRQSSETWHYIHLFDPRAVVPQSIMPSYPWLFQSGKHAPSTVEGVPIPPAFAPANGPVVPTADGTALVAYLLALKQAALPIMPGESVTTNPTTAATRSTAAHSSTDGIAEGARLFAASCASCHGAQGAGVPGVFPPLAANDVVNASDPTEHITVVLNGLHGRSVGGTTYTAQMPPFSAQLNDQDIAAIINYERTSWGNHGRTVTVHTVAAVRQKR